MANRRLTVLLTAFGSRGDVMPRVALARELRRRGHDATVACAGRWRGLVASYGLDAVSIGDYPPDEVMASAFARVAEDPDPGRRGDTLLRELFAPMLPALVQELEALEGHFDVVVLNDLLSPSACPPFIAAERLAVAVTSQPAGGLALMLRESPCVKLVGSSPTLLPPDHGLGGDFELTDFWLVDDPPPGPEVRPLLRFLESAAAPTVAVTLGSAWGTEPRLSTTVVMGAARRAGVRVVIQDLAHPQGRADEEPDMIAIGEVPYAWLFARVDAVVHHGGAGTAAEALRAGRPAITVPHYGDQLYWAGRLEAAGASAGTILPHDVTEDRLAAMLSRAVGDAALRGRAERVGAQIDVVAGVARAVDRIEHLGAGEQRRS